MLIETIQLLLVNCLFCCGIYQATQPEYLLGNIGDFIRANTKWWVCAPLIDCLTCMASVHSIWFYLPVFGFDLNWLLYVGALAGLNTLASRWM